MSRAEEILKWTIGPTVLDVGCAAHKVEPDSPYWLHGRLLKAFPSVYGIDISEERLEVLKLAGFSNLHAQNAETFSLPQQFDTIVAGEMIEHLSNPGLFLDRARLHLTLGGRLIITTCNPFSIAHFSYAMYKFPQTCGNSEHSCWLCLRTLTELASRYGFHMIHHEFIDEYRPDTPSFRWRQFGRVNRLLAPIIPKRLRADFLCVFVPNSH